MFCLLFTEKAARLRNLYENYHNLEILSSKYSQCFSGDIYKITSCFHITWFNWMPWIFPGEASFRWACVGRLVVEVRIAPEPLGYMAVRVRPLWWQGPQHGGSPDPRLLWVAVLVGIRSLALVTSMWENTLLMSNELFYKEAIRLWDKYLLYVYVYLLITLV